MRHRKIVLVVAIALLVCLVSADGLTSANAASTSQSRTSGAEVYRFFNRLNGSHFYTADPAERDSVRKNLGHVYEYEGASYSFVTPAQVDAAIADATRPTKTPMLQRLGGYVLERQPGTFPYVVPDGDQWLVIRTIGW